MSNVIPIVSSSPPPMDDSGGWDDDDFGTFTGADDSGLSTSGKPSNWSTTGVEAEAANAFTFTSWSQSETANIQGKTHSTDSGINEFANFSTGNERKILQECDDIHSDIEDGQNGIKVDMQTDGDEIAVHETTDIKQSLTDSGLYTGSSDVSPVQQTRVTDSDDKSYSDPDSVGDPHLDKIAAEYDKDCPTVVHISGENTNDSSSDKQIAEETRHLYPESYKVESDLKEICDSSNNEPVTETSKDNLQLTPESIPEAQNSSHSINDSEVSDVNIEVNAHKSAITKGCMENENDENIHYGEQQTVSKSVESKMLDTVQLEISSGLTTDNICESELKSNDVNTGSDDQVDRINHSEGSMPVTNQNNDLLENDSYQNLENQTEESGNLETISGMGSCNINEGNSEGSHKDSDLNLCSEQLSKSADHGTSLGNTDIDFELEENSQALNHSVSKAERAHDSSECDNDVTNDSAFTEHKSDDFNSANFGSDNELDDFGAFNSDTAEDEFTTYTSESQNKEVNDQTDTEDFNAFKPGDKTVSEENDFDDFTAFASEDSNDNGTKFENSNENKNSKPLTETEGSESEFGAFGDTGSSFAAFGSENIAKAGERSEQADDWAAFSEPQIAEPVAASDVDEDEWAAFGGEQESAEQKENDTTASVQPVQPSLQHLSKQEKVLYAVTGCFSSVLAAAETKEELDRNSVLEIDTKLRECDLWGNMRGLQTTNALGYHWSQSQWNNHLYSTLHVDTRNILFGHKKSSSMPIFASGLTMLEPTKGPMGSGSKSQETLVDMSKPDDSQVYAQMSTPPRIHKNDSIPPAQFDWSSSGLTNPLEAANKTLNLDFLIQEAENSTGKSHALESEFLTPEDVSTHKPTSIQPLENILANLKSSSTFKPTNQKEDLSQEASRIIQSLPNLSFMKTKVLMFPLKMNE